MSLKTQMVTDLDIFMNDDEFGVSAAYYPVAGDPVYCNVLLDHDADIGPSGFDAEIVEIGIKIEALFADVGTPKQGSYFSIEGKIYTVKRVLENDRVFVKVAVNES